MYQTYHIIPQMAFLACLFSINIQTVPKQHFLRLQNALVDCRSVCVARGVGLFKSRAPWHSAVMFSQNNVAHLFPKS